jgi:hypothetical protein
VGYDQGGGPVWHLWEPAFEALNSLASTTETIGAVELLRTWTVRLEAGSSDWLHEREWRIPVPCGVLDLEPRAVEAVIVGDPEWQPKIWNGQSQSLDFRMPTSATSPSAKWKNLS